MTYQSQKQFVLWLRLLIELLRNNYYKLWYYRLNCTDFVITNWPSSCTRWQVHFGFCGFHLNWLIIIIIIIQSTIVHDIVSIIYVNLLIIFHLQLWQELCDLISKNPDKVLVFIIFTCNSTFEIIGLMWIKIAVIMFMVYE